MLRLILALAMGAASGACALAAVGYTLYANSPHGVWVAQCFAAWGFAVGLVCGALQLIWHGQPAQASAAMPADALARLVRDAMAAAAAERLARTGSAADRHPPSGMVAKMAGAPASETQVVMAEAPQPEAVTSA